MASKLTMIFCAMAGCALWALISKAPWHLAETVFIIASKTALLGMGFAVLAFGICWIAYVLFNAICRIVNRGADGK
jgi:hypothetical protein